ncbi:hypothetical protein ACOMHN_060856 [Nucella lapillus]
MKSISNQPSAVISKDTLKEEETSSLMPSPCGDSDSVDSMQLSDREPSAAQRNCEKYNLRRSSVRVRVQVEEKKQQPKQKKAKNRPPPLSKYRRRTANARERSRMAEINDAFQELKQALPDDCFEGKMDDEGNLSSSSSSGISSGSSSSSSMNKSKSKTPQPTKATVLRLTIDYIAALRDILGYNADSSSSEGSSGSSCGGSSGSSCGGSSGDVTYLLNDDLGSDAVSSVTPSTSSGSGDEESLTSSDLDARGMVSEMDTVELASDMDGIVMEDLDFFDTSLAAEFSPDLSPDFTATLSPDEEICLQLVTSVL